MNPLANVKSISAGLVAILLLITLSGSWYTVNETERGVLLRNGALVGVIEPGRSFKFPFMGGGNFIWGQSIPPIYQGVRL